MTAPIRMGGLLLMALLAGCDSTDTARRNVAISFSTKAGAAPAVLGTAAPNFNITITNGGNTLIITKAQLVLRELELKLSTSTPCASSGEGDDDSCEEIELGPLLIDLPVTDVLLSPISAQVPAGTYREVEFDIRRPGDDPGDAAFIAANPDFDNVSIRLEGTYNGTPFVFTSELDQEVEIEFDPPLVITEGNNNATIAVDIRAWFTNADGSIISPATANPGQPNASIVSEKIKISLRAFEDDDEDGS